MSNAPGYKMSGKKKYIKLPQISNQKIRQKYYTPQSISHPAKANIPMMHYILKKFVQDGDIVLDPMCGIGTTIIEGMRLFPNSLFIGVELESKFIKMARANIKKVKALAKKDMFMKVGRAVVIQGDTRGLSQIMEKKVNKIISSPPFGQAQSGGGIAKKGYDGPKHGPTDLVGKRSYMPQNIGDKKNISNLPYGQADKIVTSPPFGGKIQHKTNYLGKQKKESGTEYSDNPKNIGNLKHGQISKIISSPPYSKDVEPHTEMRPGDKKEGVRGYSKNGNNIGTLVMGDIDLVTTKIHRNGTGSNWNRITIPENELKILVNKFHLRDSEIAKKYGVSRSCVLNNRRRYGIKRTEIWERKAGNLDNEQFQVVLGTILGDSSFSTNTECKYRNLSFSHSETQLDYLLWKKEILSEYFIAKLLKREHLDKNGKVYYSYAIKSIVHPEFLKIYNQVYIEGRKRVTLRVLSQLDPLGIAVWFMDDGGCSKEKKNWGGHLTLATDSFSLKENKLITEWFQNKWGIKATVRKKKQGTFSLYFPSDNSRKLKDLISPFIIPSMRRKLEVADSRSVAKQKVWDKKKNSQSCYLSEMLRVYRECFKILKPEGLMILILKDFIRGGKRIPLGEDTIKLCQAAGFKYLKTYYRKIEHPSFWRVLQIQKFGESYRIDSEDILVLKK